MTNVIRRGTIKVMHKRSGAVVQEELNGSLRVFKQAEWAKELKKRANMSEAKWREYAGFDSDDLEEEQEDKANALVAGAKKVASKKKSTSNSQKNVVKKAAGATLIEEDEEDGDEIENAQL